MMGCLVEEPSVAREMDVLMGTKKPAQGSDVSSL